VKLVLSNSSYVLTFLSFFLSTEADIIECCRNSVDLDSIRKAADAETDSRKQVSKSFYTNVSSAYMEEIQNLSVPKIGFDFDSEKERYHVKVS